ncbi:hypothetical protein FF38_14087 [Lucilia cuprina]|uniref:C2H2-type domain-containing protein n=1 Tax=Lucilia cuprina TaxID=7375 RepID=A0A0L0BMG5_LUCCU|nr:Zinc finger protein 93 [Lucilia cuprina]KNC21236.1 hypothetical protein FF38_14087 [Lucilia cuprina]
MDSCLLCLELNKNLENCIKTNSTQWQELNVTKVLEKHFWPMNLDSCCWMCLSCWKQLEAFNIFYTRIKDAHVNFGKIKIEENQLLAKDEDGSNENLLYSCLEQEMLIDQNAVDALMDKKTCEQFKNYDGDPLVNTKSRQTSKTTRKSISKGLNATEIKTEPNDSFNEDTTDSVYDDNDEVNDYEPSKNFSDNIKDNKNHTRRKDNDKFIAEHFKQMFCDLCDSFSFDSFTVMQKHFEIVHEQKGYLVCCNKKFFERSRLVEHLHIHLNPDHFKCPHCSKVLSNRENLQKHILGLHRPNGVVLKHVCETCGKSFVKASLLAKHKMKHLPEEEKKFPCTQCGKFYASSYLLNQHIQVVHLKKFVKICYICGKSISTSTEYKLHMDKHEGVPQPIINCDICGLRLTSERGLKRHKESQHPVGGKQDHPCPVCHKISPTQRALRKHINTMHEKGYDHKCTICEKAFKRTENLREHMASHTGTTLYTCSWCPKTFNSNGNMHAHRKKMHPKEWEEAKLQKYSGNLPTVKGANLCDNS